LIRGGIRRGSLIRGEKEGYKTIAESEERSEKTKV